MIFLLLEVLVSVLTTQELNEMLVVDQDSKKGRESMRWSQMEKLLHVDAGSVAANPQDSAKQQLSQQKHSVFKTPKRERHE